MSAHIAIVFGTRPEAIKLSPVVRALRADPLFRVSAVAAGQHRDLLDQAVQILDMRPDVSLGIMRENQDLFDVSVNALQAIRQFIEDARPDAILVQGDTTTAAFAGLAAFYTRTPLGHVEAGLRSGDRHNPFPEEMNRRLIGSIADWHFAPTARARAHLLAEGVHDDAIFVTGNTAIDALQHVLSERRDALPTVVDGLRLDDFGGDRHLVLVTCHRRESFGADLASICDALLEIASAHQNIQLVYPVHPNPQVTAMVHARLHGHPRISLLRPLDYLSFVAILARARLVLTDSGGVQEEAPALGIPVLVLRKTTERPEAIDAGVAKLIGTDSRRIVEEASLVLTDRGVRTAMARAVSPYGDGRAADRIRTILRERLRLE